MRSPRFALFIWMLCLVLMAKQAVANTVLPAAANLPGEWQPFAGALNNGCNGIILAMLKLQDGRIVVGGRFAACGDAAVSNIAIYTPATDSWESVGEGISGGTVTDIVEAASGFYVSGNFSIASGVPARNVAHWNGQQWQALGEGLVSRPWALAYFEDALYAAGNMLGGNQPTNELVQRWNGDVWETLATSTDSSSVNSLVVFKGALFAGGNFTKLAGVNANSIIQYRAGVWSAVAEGVRSASGSAGEITEMSAASSRLCATGEFAMAGAALAKNLACWDGLDWNALGGGMRTAFEIGDIDSVTTNDDFYVGSFFPVVPEGISIGASKLVGWNGNTWSNLLPGGSAQLHALALGNEGLYAGGWSPHVPDFPFNNVARLDASVWKALGNIVGQGMLEVSAAAMFQGQLFVAGSFRIAGTVQTRGIARWDGQSWQPVGSPEAHGLVGYASTLHATEDALYVGGEFVSAGGVPAVNLARWDGNAWSAVGSWPGSNRIVLRAIQYHNGALYVGASCGDGLNNRFCYVLRWDGTQWSIVGTGFTRNNTLSNSLPRINELAVHDGQLYVGGFFNSVGSGNINAWNIARWDGTNWVPVINSQFAGGVNGEIHALTSGPDGLYVGGTLTAAGNINQNGTAGSGAIAAGRVARWNGSQWQALGSGLIIAEGQIVSSMTTLSNRVIVGGSFSSVGGVAASNIASWNGTQWSRLGSGTNSTVSALVPINNSDLYVGGAFGRAGTRVSVGVALWNTDTGVIFLDGFEGN